MASAEQFRSSTVPSSFDSGRRRSALWFSVNPSTGEVRRWASQGSTVVRTIQARLGVEPDGLWGPETNDALRRAAASYGLGDAFVVNGRVTPEMLERALALAYTIGHLVRPAPGAVSVQMAVPAGATMPRWMAAPPADGASAGSIESWLLEGPEATPSPTAATDAPGHSPDPTPSPSAPTPGPDAGRRVAAAVAVGVALATAAVAWVVWPRDGSGSAGPRQPGRQR